MTRLVNDAEGFAKAALAGFAATQPDRVVHLPGGVIRAAEPAPGQVAIVTGGGSGHFPAFAGWVGVGFVSGAAAGNVFASPSQAQVVRVARAAESSGGIVMIPINYAGDILHFGGAAEELRAAGVDVRLVAVTDDIASGSTQERSTRRGIAGSFVVIKTAGAAAEQGWSIDRVEEIAIRANEATRSFGVALSGCTLPGADSPLFTLAPGRMAVGLGIHGEPGLSEVDLGTADEVADLLVDGLFAERAPEPGRRLVVVVNGLGGTTQDELAVVYSRVAARLEAAGMTVVAPVVGDFVTSLDMAGLSVSFTYLDEELESLWLAPADSAAFTRGAVGARRLRTRDGLAPALGDLDAADGVGTAASTFEVGSPESQAAARRLAEALAIAHAVLATEEARLGALDAVAGDGDHGAGMLRGAGAALDAVRRVVDAGAGAGTSLRVAGAAWSDVGGGTSGALWGAGLVAAGDAVGDQASLGAAEVGAAARAFLSVIAERGGAAAGDKTMIDALAPFVDELESALGQGMSLTEAWSRAAQQATSAAEATAGFVARAGRSRIHGERSLGTPDPGATSLALIVTALS